MEYLRDQEIPRTLQRLDRLEVLLDAYSARSAENARRARNDLFGVRNSRKARDGASGRDARPKFMDARKGSEEKLRSSVRTLLEHENLGAHAGASGAGLGRIARAQQAIAEQRGRI